MTTQLLAVSSSWHTDNYLDIYRSRIDELLPLPPEVIEALKQKV